MAKQPVIITRRKRYPSDDLVPIQSRVTPTIAEQLTDVAAKESRSVSAQIAVILEQWFAKNI